MRLRVSAKVAVAVVLEASETEDGCAPGGAVVGGEVVSVELRWHHQIRLVRRSYAFACLSEPREQCILSLVEAYYVGGGTLYFWQRRKRKVNLEKIVRNCNE